MGDLETKIRELMKKLTSWWRTIMGCMKKEWVGEECMRVDEENERVEEENKRVEWTRIELMKKMSVLKKKHVCWS
jgi:NurA-like 5'-3' nuclease